MGFQWGCVVPGASDLSVFGGAAAISISHDVPPRIRSRFGRFELNREVSLFAALQKSPFGRHRLSVDRVDSFWISYIEVEN